MTTETITWLGHSSFRLDAANGMRIYIDPWLTNPNCPEAEREPERIDVLALTHGHDDHLGETTLQLCRRHRPSIVAINELSWWLEGQLGSGHDFQRMNKGGTHSVRGVRISMTDARHSSSVWPDDSPAGFYVGEPVGFVFHLESATIYFAGDTDVFGDMALIRRLHQPDIAVLPVGDRATMGPHGAALALELLEPRVCIPCHYGTWPDFFTGTPEDLSGLTSVPILTPAFGDPVDIAALLNTASVEGAYPAEPVLAPQGCRSYVPEAKRSGSLALSVVGLVDALKERRADGTALAGLLDHKQAVVDAAGLVDQLGQVSQAGLDAEV